MKLNLESPEVHSDWLRELYQKMKMSYSSVNHFSESSNINRLDAFWFFKGTPVNEDAFKNICNALDVDWQQVQNPR